mmetsp:Transcript_36762/g.84244  ORF Transcript_36762/g.84244 Transcript_36762/m.84244 type:complete len:289 (+) Transcript_36762:3-869(+)
MHCQMSARWVLLTMNLFSLGRAETEVEMTDLQQCLRCRSKGAVDGSKAHYCVQEETSGECTLRLPEIGNACTPGYSLCSRDDVGLQSRSREAARIWLLHACKACVTQLNSASVCVMPNGAAMGDCSLQDSAGRCSQGSIVCPLDLDAGSISEQKISSLYPGTSASPPVLLPPPPPPPSPAPSPFPPPRSPSLPPAPAPNKGTSSISTAVAHSKKSIHIGLLISAIGAFIISIAACAAATNSTCFMRSKSPRASRIPIAMDDDIMPGMLKHEDELVEPTGNKNLANTLD